MKFRYVIITIFLYSTGVTSAQLVVDSWWGNLDVMGQQLPLVLDIETNDEGIYSATLQSPKQSSEFINVDTILIEIDSIFFLVDRLGVAFNGSIFTDSIVGVFKQNGMNMPLTLLKGEYEKKIVVKPQDPKPPFPYSIENVEFKNTIDSIILAGTLTIPPVSNPPVVILISGSGPQDRNEEILGHKPFWVLADHLSRQGIAVLRYDDRGVGKSTGSQKGATSFDFAKDVEAAIEYLKFRDDLAGSSIGLIGHSEGGLIAPIVISDRPESVSFFISLAGPGIRGKEVIVSQTVAGLRVAGAHQYVIDFDSLLMESITDRVLEGGERAILKADLEVIIQEQLKSATGYLKAKHSDHTHSMLADQFSSPWMVTFISHDPKPNLSRIKCPSLFLNGEKDVQVLPELNLTAIKDALDRAKNKDVTIMELKNLNHLFQTAKSGSGFEYSRIEETFSPIALNTISNWILDRF